MNDQKVSIAKGIGMVLVVAGHCHGAYTFAPFQPYSFHMPLFFFISGYLITEERASQPLRLIAMRVRSILVPYCKYFLGFGILTSLLQHFTTIQNFGGPWYNPLVWLDAFVTGDSGQLFLTGWFLVSLFWALLIFAGVVALSKVAKISPVWLLPIFLASAMLCIRYGQLQFPLLQYRVFNLLIARNIVSAFFVFCGFLVRKYQIGIPSRKTTIIGALFLAQFAVANVFANEINFDSGSNTYSSVWLPFVTSFLGIALIFTLSSMVGALPKSDWLIRIGDNSLHVMAMHLAVFEMINIAQCVWYGYSFSAIRAEPDLIINWPVTWPIYVILGLIIPVILAETWRRKLGPSRLLRRPVASRRQYIE